MNEPILAAIMAQAQAFASSWSLVGSSFASDNQREQAEAEKAELREMIFALIIERDEARARIEAMEKQAPFDADSDVFRSAFEAALKAGNWPATRKGDGYRSPSTQIAWGIAFSTVNRLKLYLAPGAQSDLNLSCKSVQKRLAAQWGYVRSDAQAVPEGFQLVPIEPTPEMLARTSAPGCAKSDWEKMIAAAPKPEEPK